jgi:hypothetical protein
MYRAISALREYHCTEAMDAASRIFEKGLQLFEETEVPWVPDIRGRQEQSSGSLPRRGNL